MRARQRRAVEHQPMLEELLAAEVLEIRVLGPALAQRLVAEVIGVFEDGKPRHQSRRQRRLSRLVAIDGAELLFQKAPVDRARQLHQGVLHVDDRVEPRPEQILRAALASLPWLHPCTSDPAQAKNHRTRFAGIPKRDLQENRAASPKSRQL
jgi:hypothetical protein